MRASGGKRGSQIAALCADTGHQQRHLRTDDFAHAGEFVRARGADHQTAVVVRIPFAGGKLGDVLVQMLPVGQREVLQLPCAGVGRAAEHEHALVAVFQPRGEGIAAHVGVDGDGVCAKASEGFFGVPAGGVANVAAFGVQHHGNARVCAVNVGNQGFQRALGAQRGERGNLRLEGAGKFGGGIHDAGAKFQHAFGRGRYIGGQTGGVGVKPDAQQGLRLLPARVQGGGKIHHGL